MGFALLSILFVGLSGCWLLCFVNACSSVAGRFLGEELHVGFWDAPKPGGILIGFVKL